MVVRVFGVHISSFDTDPRLAARLGRCHFDERVSKLDILFSTGNTNTEIIY